MKLSHPKIGLLLLVLLVSTSGCGYINGIRAKSQLNEAVSAYKDKKYDEAEQYARRALELDRSNENAPLILAIILQTQFRQGDVSERNESRATEAVELYKKVQEKNPNDDQAFTAVTRLIGFLAQLADQKAQNADEQADKPENADKKDKLKEDANKFRAASEKFKKDQVDWVRQRAENTSVSDSRRSDAYAFLADQQWSDSISVTDKNKQVIQAANGDTSTKYKMPDNKDDFTKATNAVAEGLKLAETAIKLNAENETALAEKYKLLLESAKLAKMEGDDKKADDFEKQATVVRDQGAALHKKAKPQPEPQPAG